MQRNEARATEQVGRGGTQVSCDNNETWVGIDTLQLQTSEPSVGIAVDEIEDENSGSLLFGARYAVESIHDQLALVVLC